jgi:hypothetical protein
MASGSSTYNPPGLGRLPLLTGSGSALPGVKAYEARIVFKSSDEDWIVADGVERTFGQGSWSDPVVGSKGSGFGVFGILPTAPGQYWKVKWLGRISFIDRGETSIVATVGMKFTNPTGGTEQTSQQIFQDDGDTQYFNMEWNVSPKTSFTRTDNAFWTKFSPFGSLSSSGATAGARLPLVNEIVCELWNGPFPSNNRRKGLNQLDTSYNLAPTNL